MENQEEDLPELKKSANLSSQGKGSVFFKSFLLLAFALIILVVLSWSFGWVAVEKYNPDELFDQYQNSRPEMRAPVLMEWLRMLSQDSNSTQLLPNLVQEERFRSDLSSLRMELPQDRLLAAPLISILGFSQAPDKTQELLLEFSKKIPAHQGTDAHLALLFSLARLNVWDERSFEVMEQSSQDGEASVRKTVAYVLASIPEDQKNVKKPILLRLLSDSVNDVRWNAALSLFRLGFEEGNPLLHELLQRVWSEDFLDRSSTTLEDENLYAQIFTTLQKRPLPEFKKEIEKIANSHPHVKLRRLALEALRY